MIRKLFLFLVICSIPHISKANTMQSNDSTTDREALGYSNNVKSVFIDSDSPREYTFNKHGNLIKEIRTVGKYTWYYYYTYDSGLLIEKIRLWTFREFVTYQYNEIKQVIKEQYYRTVPNFFIDSIGNMHSTYDSSSLDLKQHINEGKIKQIKNKTYNYNNEGKLIKEEHKSIIFNPMSRAAMYGAAKNKTIHYFYDKNGQLKKSVEKAPRSRVHKIIEIFK